MVVWVGALAMCLCVPGPFFQSEQLSVSPFWHLAFCCLKYFENQWRGRSDFPIPWLYQAPALTVWFDIFNDMELLYFWAVEWRPPALYYNGVSRTLGLKKTLLEMVVTMEVPSTWEARALETESGRVSFAGLPAQDLEIYFLNSPFNWCPCCTFLE